MSEELLVSRRNGTPRRSPRARRADPEPCRSRAADDFVVVNGTIHDFREGVEAFAWRKPRREGR